MTISSREATSAYIHALNNMANTKPGVLARAADRMAGDAFDNAKYVGINPISTDGMMDIETAIFIGLCRSNGVDWRLLIE
jgi:hypothetical protein